MSDRAGRKCCAVREEICNRRREDSLSIAQIAPKADEAGDAVEEAEKKYSTQILVGFLPRCDRHRQTGQGGPGTLASSMSRGLDVHGAELARWEFLFPVAFGPSGANENPLTVDSEPRVLIEGIALPTRKSILRIV